MIEKSLDTVIPNNLSSLLFFQGSYRSGKTWKTWKLGVVFKKSGKKSGEI